MSEKKFVGDSDWFLPPILMGNVVTLGEGKFVIIPESRLSMEDPEDVVIPRGIGSDVFVEVATVLEARQDILVDFLSYCSLWLEGKPRGNYT